MTLQDLDVRDCSNRLAELKRFSRGSDTLVYIVYLHFIQRLGVIKTAFVCTSV